MKIFWFTNIVLPELATALGRKPEVVGGWMSSLLDAMREQGDVEIAVATLDPEVSSLAIHLVKRVTYFRLPGGRMKVAPLAPAFIASCAGALDAFKPDIIHVHGTEDVYGLFTALHEGACPAVVSIQGLIHVYCRHVRGGLGLGDSLVAGRAGMLASFRYLLQERQWVKRGRIEQRVIRGNGHFIGRTRWDRAHVMAVNPAAQYYHGEEMLRPAFFASRWKTGTVRRHTVFCTAAHSPLKGFHWLLYAVAMLRHEFPQINVRVAGAPWNGTEGCGYYGRYIKRLIDKLGLSRHITPLPSLSAEDVAEELRLAHVFVIPSLIDNSPNSLGEAMLVGTPCIASLVGGIPSMIDDGETALGFPSGDPEYLGDCIRRVFIEDSLALSLSAKARAVAMDRYDPAKVVAGQLEIYRLVIADNSTNTLEYDRASKA